MEAITSGCTTSNGTMNDFTRLREITPHGEVLLPGDAGYEEKLQRWSAACVKRAVCWVVPSSDNANTS